MSTTREDDTQQAPVPNVSRPIADILCEDIQRRAEHGQRKYGTKLQAHNGRNALQDAYEEALDLCHYLKQRLIEEVWHYPPEIYPPNHRYVLGYWEGQENPYEVVCWDSYCWLRNSDDEPHIPPTKWRYL